MTIQQNPVTYGKVIVAPAAVEGELRKIHHDAAISFTKQSNLDTTRAKVTLANIVILSLSGGQLTQKLDVSSLIETLCLSYPSRFFVVGYHATDAQSNSSLTTAVSSRCVIADSGHKVCSEEIYISTTGSNVRVIQNLMRSLLVADVPVGLIILCDPRDPLLHKASSDKSNLVAQHGLHFKTLVSTLLDLSDFIVYDSSLFFNFSESFRVIDELKRPKDKSKEVLSSKVPEKAAILGEGRSNFCDIVWQRNKKWMSLLAEQFDGVNATLLAESISECEIECRLPAGQFKKGKLPADVLLFVAWICQALNLSGVEIVELDDSSVTINACRVLPELLLPIKIRISPRDTNDTPAQVLSAIKLNLTSAKGSQVIQMKHDSQANVATITKTIVSENKNKEIAKDSFVRVVPFAAISDSNLILSRLFSKSGGSTYESSFRFAARVSDKIISFIAGKDSRK
jgi:glucose-6-phosphate dehydrogenase assembly protein OpcA